jgi:hypothetical protein
MQEEAECSQKGMMNAIEIRSSEGGALSTTHKTAKRTRPSFKDEISWHGPPVPLLDDDSSDTLALALLLTLRNASARPFHEGFNIAKPLRRLTWAFGPFVRTLDSRTSDLFSRGVFETIAPIALTVRIALPRRTHSCEFV